MFNLCAVCLSSSLASNEKRRCRQSMMSFDVLTQKPPRPLEGTSKAVSYTSYSIIYYTVVSILCYDIL